MPIPREVQGTIACGDETHRLMVTDDGLRLLDHEQERDQVVAALGGTSECHAVGAAWEGLLHQHVGGPPDRYLRLLFVETLMPDEEFPDRHREREAQSLEFAARLAATAQSTLARPGPTSVDPKTLATLTRFAGDTGRLLSMPDRLRNALALQWVKRTLDAGEVRDPELAATMRQAVTHCWETMTADGHPSPAARLALVQVTRTHR